jgi:hypothetical protein
VQTVDVMLVYGKCLLAAKLCVEMTAGLHVLEARLMESGRHRAIGSCGGLLGETSDCSVFVTIHIGAFRPLETAAGS